MSFLSQLQAWCLKNRLLVVISGIVLVGLLVVFVQFAPTEPEPVANPLPLQQNASFETGKSTHDHNKMQNNQQQPIPIVVDIKGAVKRPNTYQMMSDDRIKQLLDKAGILPNSDLSQINLAEKLTDQKMLYIPKKGEQPKAVVASNDRPSSTDNQPVNLNTAQLSDLTNVPGIGPAKAQAILSYREEKGQFQSVEQLKEVKGIGDKTYENLSTYFTV
ncbi:MULTISPECIES: helix-hairpin-helix domain-containing protein [unclassified Staphylococcus]|uniref:helix-hairpin-helix domain-containing protein n=1 Tax=unclassified Staphylococcus TaxID=91994 RepID=UPI0021D16040|nr:MULTISPECIES: helix-hairpin-helix domain-containing protein [unclassified Staphylococcus]UXR77350.1 helix-hairpin-helix domain-containing protein [Staphylococcus sp. IVB6227]UXR81613.1 helix-hairpin-helix domain-containing protein [Staphylococcus sp. IVB6214]